MIESALKELGPAIRNDNIPVKEALENSSKASSLDWNPVISYSQIKKQPLSPFNEKNIAIEYFVKLIVSCKNILAQNSLTNVLV